MHHIYYTLFLLIATALAATLNPLAATPTTLTATITRVLPADISADWTAVPYNPLIMKSTLNCGKFNTADGDDLKGLLHELIFDIPKTKVCLTPARTCRRHACQDTTAIYVCNDTDEPLGLGCTKDVGRWAFRIAAECCRDSGSKSGQIFNDERGYNVIAAYGNCNHGKDSDHPAMGPADDPWGPNGECK